MNRTAAEDKQETLLMNQTLTKGKSNRIWLGIGFSVLMMAILGASYGPALTRQQYREVKNEISQLKQDERQRLSRNLQQYEKLSAADQQRYWEMDQYLREHDLMPVMDAYMQWLKGLSPIERQELRNSDDAAARVATVEQLLREKREQEENRLPELIARLIEQEESAPPPLKFLLRQRKEFDFDDPYVLSKPQLETIVDQVFLPQLTMAQQNEMNAFQGTDRMFRILRTSLNMINNPRESWPSEQAFEQIEKAGIMLVSQSSPQKKEIWGREIPANLWKRLAFRRLLVRSLIVYEMQEFERRYLTQKNENDLLTYFAKLDSSAQAALLDSPADYQAEALKWLYIWNTYRGESVFNKVDFRDDVLNKLIPQGFSDRGSFRMRGEGPGGPETREGRGTEFFRPDGRGPGGPDRREGRPPGPPPEFREGPPPGEPPPPRN